jgi:hypothetical protein
VTEPYFDPGDVAQIAGDDILAVLLRSGDLYIAEKTIQKLPFLLLSIRVAESTVYAIDQDHHLRVIGSADRAPFQNERILSFALSSAFFAAITTEGDCKVVIRSTDASQAVTANCVAVGYTAASVFAVTDANLIQFSADGTKSIPSAKKIVAVECSEDDAFLIDEDGALSRIFDGSLIVISGLPRVVAVSAGIQHAAALGADGRVFVWGFNPSGQLGIGPDRVIATPRRVLHGAHMVACGSQNTWALLGPGRPKLPTWMKVGTEKAAAKVTDASGLPFSERPSI